jgi:energy-coupling factor transporter ATP-binding protein EcfA2
MAARAPARVSVSSFTREEFLARRFRYKPGEHVTFVGPTQNGKTTLAFALLERVLRPPKHQAVALVMKPRDGRASQLIKHAEFRMVRRWPPPPRPWESPPGWALWPKATGEIRRDNVLLEEQFRHAINDNYSRGDRILFADETYGLTRLGLGEELDAVWTRGSGMGAALWAASQRPRGISLNAYSQAEHVFLSFTPDKQDRDRYAEIGGVDPDVVKSVTAQLDSYHWLYVRRTGRVMCVVEPA